jgi:threonine/homoserine/homoserine lactone efflux protein
MTWTTFGGFLVAITLGSMVPGSTTALVIRQSAVVGARASIPLVIGVEIGLYAWVVASAVGVAAVVAASETAYTALRLVGAGVLMLLGVRMWLASRRTGADLSTVGDLTPSGRWWQVGVTGALTQLANPKVAVFMIAFFPQFVPSGSHVLVTTLLLGLVQVVVDGGWYLLVAAFVGRARRLVGRPRFRRRLERATGTVLIGLGVRMAVSRL